MREREGGGGGYVVDHAGAPTAQREIVTLSAGGRQVAHVLGWSQQTAAAGACFLSALLRAPRVLPRGILASVEHCQAR